MYILTEVPIKVLNGKSLWDEQSILKLIDYLQQHAAGRSAKNSRLHLIPKFYDLTYGASDIGLISFLGSACFSGWSLRRKR